MTVSEIFEKYENAVLRMVADFTRCADYLESPEGQSSVADIKEIAGANLSGRESWMYILEMLKRNEDEQHRKNVIDNPSNATEEDKKVVDYLARIAPEGADKQMYIEISELIGKPADPIPIYRPPHLDLDDETRALLERSGYKLPRFYHEPYEHLMKTSFMKNPTGHGFLQWAEDKSRER